MRNLANGFIVALLWVNGVRATDTRFEPISYYTSARAAADRSTLITFSPVDLDEMLEGKLRFEKNR